MNNKSVGIKVYFTIIQYIIQYIISIQTRNLRTRCRPNRSARNEIPLKMETYDKYPTEVYKFCNKKYLKEDLFM